jgi:hypothetical protein
VIGHRRCADGAEENGVSAAQLVEAVGRHHPPFGQVVFAAPRQIGGRDGEAMPLGGGVDNGQGRRCDFLANTVAGDDRKLVVSMDWHRVLGPLAAGHFTFRAA